MEESTKELIGITPASLLASLGFLIVGVVFLTIFYRRINLIISDILFFIGISSTSIAVYINSRKRGTIKWRNINRIVHIIMLVLMVLFILFYNFFI